MSVQVHRSSLRDTTSWWWTTASNPPCLPQCRDRHRPDEFSIGGMLTCLLGTFADPRGRRMVDVIATQVATDTPGQVEVTACEISAVYQVADSLTIAEARDFSTALARAAVLVGELA